MEIDKELKFAVSKYRGACQRRTYWLGKVLKLSNKKKVDTRKLKLVGVGPLSK